MSKVLTHKPGDLTPSPGGPCRVFSDSHRLSVASMRSSFSLASAFWRSQSAVWWSGLETVGMRFLGNDLSSTNQRPLPATELPAEPGPGALLAESLSGFPLTYRLSFTSVLWNSNPEIQFLDSCGPENPGLGPQSPGR